MLVGRRAEQQAIARLVAGARLGTSGVLALTGEAGVGKTALLDEAVSGLEDMRVLRVTGLESEREIPFAGLLQLLHPALRAMDSIPPAQADALSAALALPVQRAPVAPRDRFAIGAAVLSLLCRFAEEEPLALVADDVQLIDAPSAEALVFAVRRLTADPIVCLLAARSPEGDRLIADLPVLAVTGLDATAARTLLAGIPGSALPEAIADGLHRATDGNPLALLELGNASHEILESAAAGLPLRVPSALADSFGRRLAQVDDECRAVLLLAAVSGPDLSLLLRACANSGRDAVSLDDAEDRGLVLRRDGQVVFRHPLLRSAVYSRASTRERRAAHRAVADATPLDDVDRRAWHLSEAVWYPDAAVAALLDAAGEHALERSAHAIAAGAFERSARLTPDDAVRGTRLLRAADAAWTAGMGGRAVALLDEHERAAAFAADRVPELALRATIAARSGSLREALDTLIAAAELTEDADQMTVILADAVHACYYLADARSASTLADRLQGLRSGVRTPAAHALGLMGIGMGKVLCGRGGAEEIRSAVPLLESDPTLRLDPRRLSWLLLAPLFLRDADGGGRLRALVEDVRGAAGVGALPAVLFHVARDQSMAAEWTRAEANFAEAIRLAAETGQTTELAMSSAGLSWLESRAGRVASCRAYAATARELCGSRDIHMGEVWADFAMGDLELSLGHAERAVEELSTLVALLERLGFDDVDLIPAPELVDALARLGRHDDAGALAHDYRERALRKGQPWARARADRACGHTAPVDELDEWFESALAWHERTLDGFETARTRLAYGERLRRTGRRVDARVQLQAAMGLFDDLGATIWRGRAATELTATGAHARPAPAGGAVDLTPQELQVCFLLADGRTTREAAAALFLSPKTVEYHLRKVYVKLGISSREELSRALAQASV